MYLVIEKSNSLYAYFESKRQFEKMQKDRVASGYLQLELSALDDECDLRFLAKNTYIVIPVEAAAINAKRAQARRKKKRTHV